MPGEDVRLREMGEDVEKLLKKLLKTMLKTFSIIISAKTCKSQNKLLPLHRF